MLRDKKDTSEHLKDSSNALGILITDTREAISYTKTEKLITALYMVTDIIDKDEPLRNKLRTLGTNIISDINGEAVQAISKISEVMSFLDIASAMNIISQMNTSILRKEFLELDQAVRESSNKANIIDKKIDLSEFFSEEGENSHPSLLKNNSPHLSGTQVHKGHTLPPVQRGQSEFQGHAPRRLGVQKPSELMQSLKDIAHGAPAPRQHMVVHEHINAEQFDILKKQRREDIINIIKIMGGNATIKDIKDKAQSLPDGANGRSSALKTCGEKTLQRELASMVTEGVLKKTGEKRWSRYFVK